MQPPSRAHARAPRSPPPDIVAGRGRRVVVAAVVAVVGLLAGCSSAEPPAGSPATSAPGNVLAEDGEIGATDGPPSPVTVPPLHPSVDDWPSGQVVVAREEGSELVPVAVRIADTPARRSHGLMEVPEVPDGVGMWFTYDEDQVGAYWMKGTLVDLDIAWVDDNGRIVAIETMESCDADPCPTYAPGVAYRTALEVRAGWFADNDVEVGDRVLRGRP